MSTVTVRYYLSDQALRRIAVETGEVTSEEQTLVIDLAPLTASRSRRFNRRTTLAATSTPAMHNSTAS